MASFLKRTEKCKLLIHGYARRTQYFLPQTIPLSVILLIFDFFDLANSNEYIWQISDPSLLEALKTAMVGEQWKSPCFSMLGFKWFLNVYPKGSCSQMEGHVNLYLNLLLLPPKIKLMRIGLHFSLVEVDTAKDINEPWNEDNMDWGWGKQLQSEQIKDCDSLTFMVSAEMYGLFDKDDEEITDHYVLHHHGHKPSTATATATATLSAQKLDALMVQMERLNERMEGMQQKMESMDEKIDGMMAAIHAMKEKEGVHAESDELRVWLEDEVGLPMYYRVFVENGIEELSVAALLEKETLKAMGIDVIGHQIKILSQTKRLKANQ